jgi:hypothetical protein
VFSSVGLASGENGRYRKELADLRQENFVFLDMT